MVSTREILKKVKKIEIKTKHLVDGILQGAYHSIFKGSGIEFSDVREYTPGDDIRTIDWNITARMNKPFVKEYIEERDVTVFILFDCSSSGEFGTIVSKKETATELAASLMFAAMRNNDRVGMMMFTDHVEKFIPAKKGKRHVLKLISNLVSHEPESKKTDIKSALIFLSRVIKKRSIIFLISDFISPDFERPLKILKNKHDIIAVNINDIREQEIPNIGYIELEDEETGEQILVNTSDKRFRNEYVKLVKAQNTKLKKTLTKLKIDIIQLMSGTPYEIPLKQFFETRTRRLSR